ncbi:unnamed protein product [Victoria cruziana]
MAWGRPWVFRRQSESPMVEESRRDGPLKRRGFLGGGFQVGFAIEENGRCSAGLAEGTERLVFIKRIVCIGDFNVQMVSFLPDEETVRMLTMLTG